MLSVQLGEVKTAHSEMDSNHDASLRKLSTLITCKLSIKKIRINVTLYNNRTVQYDVYNTIV